jgi:hypothetical protein
MLKATIAAALAAGVLTLAGCAARQPVLYPNQHYDQVGRSAAERDVEACKQRAASHDRLPAAETARTTVVGSGIGAAAGAAGGAIWGHAGRGAASGAAGGAAAGLLHALLGSNEPSPTYKSYVTACLDERGYRVVGWE